MASVFMGANAIAWAFSPIGSVSLWGKWPLSDGYAIYTMASYFVLFLVIATHLKTRP